MSTASSSESLALIAGSTQMPRLVAEQAREQGRAIVAIAIEGVTDPVIADLAAETHWLSWGDVSGFLSLLNELRGQGVREAVMVGKVEQQRIYDQDSNAEMRGLLSAVPVRHTDSLIGTVVKLMAGAGIELRECTDFLQPYVVRRGVLTSRNVDDREHGDVSHGWNIAKSIGGLDIGQSVVVKDRAVVAVEAMEGTDECLRRAGGLAGEGTVLVKVAKPAQDLRFDVPVVGIDTIATMTEVGATALCVEADMTVLFDRDEFLDAANTAGIAVVARKEPSS